MRAVVTGGAGFLGSSLVDRLLAEGHSAEVVDDLSGGSLAWLAEARASRGEFRFHQLDVTGPGLSELFARRRPEVVFHMAASTSLASSVSDPVGDAEACLVGALKVLEAARLAGARKIVVASSGTALFGRGREEAGAPPFAESDRRPALSPWVVARSAVVDYLAAYRQSYGLEFSVLALGTVYGPRQLSGPGSGAVVSFSRSLATGRPPILDGDGSQTRDFVYVDDVVDAFSRAKDRGSGLLVNVGTGIETSVGSLWSTMSRIAGTNPGVRRGSPRPAEVARVALDATRAGIHLGWRPWTSLEQGLTSVLRAAGALHTGESTGTLSEEALG